MSSVTRTHTSTVVDITEVHALFEEYAASLGFSLCFQGFDDELAGLPGAYAPPQGRLLLARFDGIVAGCVAVRLGDGAREDEMILRPALAPRPRARTPARGRHR